MSLVTKLRRLLNKFLAMINARDIGAYILCYHSIGNDKWQYSVSLESFIEQMDYLMFRYKAIDFVDIKKILNNTAVNPKTPAVAINFDDGYESIYQLKDYLKTKGIKPTVFLLSEPDKANKKQLGNNHKFLSKEQVLDLYNDGWTFGSHGATHADFWKLSKDKIQREVVESKNKLESEYGIPFKYFSYPRGRYTPEIIKSVKNAGYELAVSMDDGYINNDTDPFILPRIGINGSHQFDEFETLMIERVVKARKYIKNFGGGVLRNFI